MLELPEITPLPRVLEEALWRKLDAKTKPPRSLGRLERLAVQMGRAQGTLSPRVARPSVVVFAADHGIVEEGVSAWPQSVTAEMVRNIVTGGSAISVLTRAFGLELTVVDSGVAAELSDLEGLVDRKVGRGTRNFARTSAMSAAERDRGLTAGIELAADEIARGSNVLGFGEMGIGNTSSAAAIMSFVADRPVAHCVGAGAGLDEAGIARKLAVLERAHARIRSALAGRDPGRREGALALLVECGGHEIVMMTGAMLGTASHRALVVVDGFIASAAALVARALAPSIEDYLVYAHRSAERGHAEMLAAAGGEPLLELGLRLGEGTGAALAVPLLRAAAAVIEGMASFEEAGVSGRVDA